MDTVAVPSAAPPAVPGTALEPRLYTDPALLEPEQALIFERTWQLAGHVGSLPRPGAYITARAGNQPVLVVRDQQHPARLPQRLPAPGVPAAQRLGPVQGGDPLPLSRLDIPARRHPDRRSRGSVVRRGT